MAFFKGLPNWLVVATALKNTSQNGNLPQIGVKINKYLKTPPSKVFSNKTWKTTWKTQAKSI